VTKSIPQASHTLQEFMYGADHCCA